MAHGVPGSRAQDRFLCEPQRSGFQFLSLKKTPFSWDVCVRVYFFRIVYRLKQTISNRYWIINDH